MPGMGRAGRTSHTTLPQCLRSADEIRSEPVTMMQKKQRLFRWRDVSIGALRTRSAQRVLALRHRSRLLPLGVQMVRAPMTRTCEANPSSHNSHSLMGADSMKSMSAKEAKKRLRAHARLRASEARRGRRVQAVDRTGD
jgi:hypothetical protein